MNVYRFPPPTNIQRLVKFLYVITTGESPEWSTNHPTFTQDLMYVERGICRFESKGEIVDLEESCIVPLQRSSFSFYFGPYTKLFGIAFYPPGLNQLLGFDLLRESRSATCIEKSNLIRRIRCEIESKSFDAVERISSIIEDEASGVQPKFSNTARQFISSVNINLSQYSDVSITQVAKTLGVSTRTLERHCLQALGLTPKEVVRINRLNRTLKTLSNGTQSILSAALFHGYFDESHFQKECQKLLGTSCTNYISEHSDLRNLFHS